MGESHDFLWSTVLWESLPWRKIRGYRVGGDTFFFFFLRRPVIWEEDVWEYKVTPNLSQGVAWRTVTQLRISKKKLGCVEMLSPSSVQFSSVQLLSRVRLFVTPWTAAHQASLSITSCQSLLKLMSIRLVMPSNHLILCHQLILLPSIFPSIRVFSSESVLIRQPKYWSFSFSISPSNEYSGVIFFRMDWLDLLAVQGTLESLLQHHSSKASIVQ